MEVKFLLHVTEEGYEGFGPHSFSGHFLVETRDGLDKDGGDPYKNMDLHYWSEDGPDYTGFVRYSENILHNLSAEEADKLLKSNVPKNVF